MTRQEIAALVRSTQTVELNAESAKKLYSLITEGATPVERLKEIFRIYEESLAAVMSR